MGEYRDSRNIRCFHPDDNENIIYRSANLSLSELIEEAKNAFGGSVDMDDLFVRAEHIQTSCLGYDGHDWSDWTDFIVIERL